LKLGKTFKPFTPQNEQNENVKEEESVDLSFLNKIFTNDSIDVPSNVWSTPFST